MKNRRMDQIVSGKEELIKLEKVVQELIDGKIYDLVKVKEKINVVALTQKVAIDFKTKLLALNPITDENLKEHIG